jgi:hypothetical protein
MWPVGNKSTESRTFENKFFVWSENIAKHLSGLNMKLLGKKEFNDAVLWQYKSFSDKISVLVNANTESKFITF